MEKKERIELKRQASLPGAAAPRALQAACDVAMEPDSFRERA